MPCTLGHVTTLLSPSLPGKEEIDTEWAEVGAAGISVT